MDTPVSADVFLFEAFRFDRRAGTLFRQDEGRLVPVRIGSRALAVLDILVARRGDLVSKEEIMDAVWPGTAVEENNLTVQISALRRVLDEGRADGSCIQTVPGRGYRFTVPVTLVAIVLVGAGQHRLTTLAHEASHYVLFKHRLLNELASDFLCMFPMWSATHHYRLQHLAHHQFPNDPERDPDIAQMDASGHRFHFPMTPRRFIWECVIKQVLVFPNGTVQTAQGGLLTVPGTNIGRFSQSRFAVVPEIGLNLGYQVTQRMKVFVGYNFLYPLGSPRVPARGSGRPGALARRGVGSAHYHGHLFLRWVAWLSSIRIAIMWPSREGFDA